MSSTASEGVGPGDPTTGTALALTLNGRTAVTLREGDSATFDVHLEGQSAGDLWFDAEGRGEWRLVAEPTLRHVYAEPGRFEPAVRVGDEIARVRLRVLRVTRSPGAGYF